MSQESISPDAPVSDRAKSTDPSPEPATTADQGIATREFIRQCQELVAAIGPVKFDDSWEGCAGDENR